MDIFPHLKCLYNVSYFKAPLGQELTPATIEAGEERIEILVNGAVMFDDGKEDLPRKCGGIFWHMAGDNTIYRSILENPYECMVFHFSVVEGTERQLPHMTFWPDPRSLREFVWEAFRAYRSGLDEKGLEELSIYCYSTLHWHASRYADGMERSAIPVVLSYLLEFVESNISRDLQVSDLTAHADVSAPYLYKLFRKHFSTSPHKYILSRKMSYACKLLTSTTQQVKQICVECGMENVETFCRVFRKSYGMTPIEYRKSGGLLE